jgi:hypothetical protein
MLGVLDATLCDKVCQWLATDRLFSPAGTPVSSTNKTYSHDITIALTKWCSRTRFFFLIPIHVVSGVRLYWYDVIIKNGCRCKWTREYSTIHFFRHLCCYSTIHGQCRVFINDLKSYPKLRVKRPLSGKRDRRGCDRMVVGFTTTYAISAYHH